MILFKLDNYFDQILQVFSKMKPISAKEMKLYIFYISFSAFVGYLLYTASNTRLQKEEQYWHYHVQESHLIDRGRDTLLKLHHYGQGQSFPVTIQIQTQTNKRHTYQVTDVGQQQIIHQLDLNKKDIKNVILKSDHPIDFSSKKVRLLQGLQITNNFLNVCISVFQIVFALLRNLIIIGIFTNSLDTVLPFIIYSQSFLMMAFWSNSKHYLTQFYYHIFNSKLDVFNFIRITVSGTPNSSTIPMLSQYGYTNNLLFNISGELMISVILLVATIIIKAGNVFLKNEKLRSITAKLRPIWNGYFFAIMPRLATFAGFQCRMITDSSSSSIISGIITSVIIILLIGFFIQLLLHIRRINSHIEYIDDSRMELGLVKRIDYHRDFQFDCLEYSMLYYPVMNYMRLLVFFLPIGASYDFYYVSYGGPIVAQLFFMMIEVSCTGYTQTRDKVLFPLCNFLIMVIALCIITVGLAQSVFHSEVSTIAEIILFAILMFIIVSIGTCLVLDVISNIKESCCPKEVDEDEEKENKANNFVKNIAKTKGGQDGCFNDKKQALSFNSDENDEKDDDFDDNSTHLKKAVANPKLKIKKVRKGKII